MKRLVASASLAAWVTTLAAGLAFMHGQPVAGPTAIDGSSYVMTAIRYGAIACGWYLAATTAISFAAHLSRSPAVVAIAERVTVRPLQRLCRAAVGATIAASLLTPSLAGAQQPPPVMTWVEEGPAVPPTLANPTTPIAPAPEAHAGEREHVVAPGEHLWSLSARRLAESLGREPNDAEIAKYWVRVVERNAAGGYLREPTLPDLIFPHQLVVLPPP